MSEVVLALLLAGLMGMLGQGVRAIVGLKTMTDQADAAGLDKNDLFRASRLLVSLMIGFIAGLAAAFAVGLDKIKGVTVSDVQVLLALAAAGYAGTDAIEGFMSNYLPGKATPATPTVAATSATGAAGAVTVGTGAAAALQPDPARPAVATPQPGPVADPAANGEGAAMLMNANFLSDSLTDVQGAITTVSTRSGALVPGTNYPVWALARDVNVARSRYWDFILEGARTYNLPVAVICGIGSRESHWGTILDPPGPAGFGDKTPRDPAKWGRRMPDDGHGWGRGLMQIDWYSHEFARTGPWQDPRENILYGCKVLGAYVQGFAKRGLDPITAIRCGVSAYNGMSGAHSSYCNDVMARADWVRQHGLDGAAPELVA